jgi:flagellar biosynthesis protein FlhF
MKTITFQAENMQKALEIVREELGPDAMVVSVRQIPGGPVWQVWKTPIIEIVAGTPDGISDPVKIKPAKKATTYEYASEPGDLHDSLAELYKKGNSEKEEKVKAVSGTYNRNKPIPVKVADSELKDPNENFGRNFDDLYAGKQQTLVNSKSRVEESKSSQLKAFASILPTLPIQTTKLLQKLLEQGVAEEYIYRVTQSLQTTMTDQTRNNPEKITSFLQKQFEASINSNKTMIGINPKIICLIGTSGVGKTSTIAKLATYYGRRLNKKVTWICADTVRSGAIAEANTYVDSIGATLKIAYTPLDLSEAISQSIIAGAEYILIDTPAFNPNLETSILELGNLITVIPKRNTWLVLPATAKEKDMNQVYSAVSHFKIRGMVVTKMDETTTFGPIFNILVKHKTPLNYLTFGSNVVNDLISAEPNIFVHSLFEERYAG